ncbi:hypothetical protein VTO73DRAFT_6422 [Trametes versicolor]
MKSASTIVFFLATALSVSALNTPHIRVRQESSSTEGPVCNGAAVVETSTLVAGNATLELTKFSCAPTLAPLVQANGGGLLGLLGGLLSWYFPFPPIFPFPPKPKPKSTTVTKVSTATATATVTKVSTATATATTTETDTETDTATVTSATTVIESVTDSATLTVTATVTAATPSSTFTNVCGAICTTVCGQSGRLEPITEDCEQLVNAITILNGQIAPTFDVEPDHAQTITFGTCRFFFQNVGPTPLEYCWLSLAQVASAAGNACFPPVQPMSSEGLCIDSADAEWQVGAAHS